MNRLVLDYFGEYEEGVAIIIARRFVFESQAHIYAARLREEGIPCFISNSHMSTALPLGGSADVLLHIKSDDLPKVEALFLAFDREQQESDFHEADHEEIEYQRQLHTPSISFWIALVVVLLILALLI